MLCAGGGDDHAGPADDDSGGPLGVHDPSSKQFVQTGIVSWGSENKTGSAEPAVFTRVSSHKKWIEAQIRELLDCSPGFGLTPDSLNCLPCPQGTKQQPKKGKFKCA